jgi:prepilin-type N-terminal cleavage/methylation domain-containing protein
VRNARRRRHEAGLTLIEVLIAVTLVSLLSVAILMALRVALDGLARANHKLMDNRRVAGAQRVLEQQLAGFMPVKAPCSNGGSPPVRIPFFQGEPESMRLVSTYSLQEAWRGIPHVLEFQVIPGDEEAGVRLIVNEIPYAGPYSAGQFCLNVTANSELGFNVPSFAPIKAGPWSFVLGDKLRSCRFWYLEPAKPPLEPHWVQNWILPRWPAAIRVEMEPLIDNPARLRPLTITGIIPENRVPEFQYWDY